MSSMDLSTYPKAALVIFLGVFVLVLLRTVRKPRTEVTHNAQLPLED
jgi:hypothetical protein